MLQVAAPEVVQSEPKADVCAAGLGPTEAVDPEEPAQPQAPAELSDSDEDQEIPDSPVVDLGPFASTLRRFEEGATASEATAEAAVGSASDLNDSAARGGAEAEGKASSQKIETLNAVIDEMSADSVRLREEVAALKRQLAGLAGTQEDGTQPSEDTKKPPTHNGCKKPRVAAEPAASSPPEASAAKLTTPGFDWGQPASKPALDAKDAFANSILLHAPTPARSACRGGRAAAASAFSWGAPAAPSATKPAESRRGSGGSCSHRSRSPPRVRGVAVEKAPQQDVFTYKKPKPPADNDKILDKFMAMVAPVSKKGQAKDARDQPSENVCRFIFCGA
uniref:Uncharacterized protein n=1 Tax=Alexandrium andersonii TaxID=327968 RepID=A0A7S2F0E7_9DINO|mmetsp:Transcript_104118/g.233746  ORF Transcript_104118/g.233746 Transcript_104118/m.233746 type:complete len:335 (+) Transcript_104118:2-1006(+)